MNELKSCDIKFIKGVGEKRAQLFNRLGIFTLDDLVRYYPRRYQDWSKTKTVNRMPSTSKI